MTHYFTLLSTYPVVKRLTLIQLLTYFGAWFSNVAIYTLLIELNVSATLIAAIAALHFIPGAIIAPFSGALVDRVSPKKLMLGLLITEVLATLGFLLITTTQDLWLMYLLIVIRMGATSVYFTAEMSLLPKLLVSTDLKLANEMHSMIWSASYTFGMALSGLFVYFTSTTAAFIVDSILFTFASILLFRQPFNFDYYAALPQKFFTQIKEGAHYLMHHKELLFLLFLHGAVGFTAYDSLVALMAKTLYSDLSSSLAIGFIHAMRALALIVGPILLSKWINEKRLKILFIFQGLAILIWALTFENYYLGLLGTFSVGFFTTTLWSYTYTLIQSRTDSRYYGRVLAYNDMFFLIVGASTSYGVGLLFDYGLNLFTIMLLMTLPFFISAYLLQRYQKTLHLI